MSTNEFQDYVVDTFVSIITMCKENNKYSKELFSSYGSMQTLKKGLITHYPSIYKKGHSSINLWQQAKIEDFKPLLMSANAYEIFNNKDNKKLSYKKYKNLHKEDEKKLLYWEHITPNDIW